MNLISYIKSIYTKSKYRFFKSSTIEKKNAIDENYIIEVNNFINNNNFYSKTTYFIWIDTKNFKTNVFKRSNNNWKLIHSYLCSLGKPWAPTIKGTFYAGPKGYSFGEARGFRCFYYTQIKDNYLIHSIPYNLDGSIRDPRLGMRLTDGCVRLATENSKWIYDNVPSGTTIFIN